jgi:calcineurin-like phosphoesterase family protein
MDEGLTGLWTETVGPDDEVWVLGDLALGHLVDSLALVGRLPGRKVLVPGNHDRCWAGSPKGVERWRAEYLAAGIDRIVDAPARFELPGGPTALVDHFPFAGDSRDGPDRYQRWRPPDDGGWLLHGHVHTVWRQRGRRINVGVDAWAGRPVPAELLAELVAAGPADREPLAW